MDVMIQLPTMNKIAFYQYNAMQKFADA